MFYNIRRGIRNIIRWLPIVWKDEDYDWEYLARIMEVKMRWMSDHFKDYPIVADSKEMSKELLICIELIKRLRKDSFAGNTYKEKDANAQRHQEMLGRIIGRKLRCWWD